MGRNVQPFISIVLLRLLWGIHVLRDWHHRSECERLYPGISLLGYRSNDGRHGECRRYLLGLSGVV